MRPSGIIRFGGGAPMRQNAVAPTRGNDIGVSANAPGCNLNLAFDLGCE